MLSIIQCTTKQRMLEGEPKETTAYFSLMLRTVRYFAKTMKANFTEILEFWRTAADCEVSPETKFRRNFDASVVILSAKFRELGGKHWKPKLNSCVIR